MKLNFLKQHYKSFSLYVFIGASGAMIQFISFSLILHFLQIHYQLAYTLSYILSVTYHFTLNRAITFKAHGHALSNQMLRYLAMILTCYLVTSGIMYISIELASLSSYLGMINAMGVSVIISYGMSRYWVFRQNQLIY